jgi:hypothetical protein
MENPYGAGPRAGLSERRAQAADKKKTAAAKKPRKASKLGVIAKKI